MGRTGSGRASTGRTAAGFAILAVLLLAAMAWLGQFGGNPYTLMVPPGYKPHPGGPVAILWSGDMGFSVGMGPAIAARMTKDGIPVVGVNSLAYFHVTRTPGEAAALLKASMERARTLNPAARLILIGQSYGADMLHVALAHLPRAQRDNIGLVALVVPGGTVAYRASASEIFTFAVKEDAALPTARLLGWVPTLCIGGREESNSLCPLLRRQHGVSSITLPGGHPLHHDDQAVYAALRTAMRQAGFARRD